MQCYSKAKPPAPRHISVWPFRNLREISWRKTGADADGPADVRDTMVSLDRSPATAAIASALVRGMGARNFYRQTCIPDGLESGAPMSLGSADEI